MRVTWLIFLAAAAIVRPVAAADGYATLACASDGERRHCAGATGAGVALIRSTGTAACLLGRTWGYDAGGVWVTEGCAAEFMLGNVHHESERAAPQRDTPGAREPERDDDGDGNFSVYTRFGAITAFRESAVEVQDNGSRLAFEYSTGDDIRFFAKGEWGISLTRGATDFNPGESTSGGFVVLDEVTGNIFGARLGYIGIDFREAGSLTLGKQWGVHYDIASYTDGFNAFGAEASATFNASSDGGLMGTGRADAALVYRNSLFGFLDVGAQVQMREFGNDDFLEGYGVALRARIRPRLEAGVSFTRAQFDDSLKGELLGLDGDGDYRIAGLRYTGDALTLGAVYAQQRNGDLVRVPVESDGQVSIVPEVFDADGVELFGRYQLGSVGLLGGYLDYDLESEQDNILIEPDAVRRYYIAGLDYVPAPGTRLYAEYRLDDSITAVGEPGQDVFIIGAKYEFSTEGTFD